MKKRCVLKDKILMLGFNDVAAECQVGNGGRCSGCLSGVREYSSLLKCTRMPRKRINKAFAAAAVIQSKRNGSACRSDLTYLQLLFKFCFISLLAKIMARSSSIVQIELVCKK